MVKSVKEINYDELLKKKKSTKKQKSKGVP